MKILTIKSKTHGTHDVLLDDEDYEKVIAKNKWGLTQGGGQKKLYVRKAIYDKGKKAKWLWLHRFLINPPDDMYVDHINGNPLDNRKENLRIVTAAQNSMNLTTPRGKMPYLGVKSSGPRGLKKYRAMVSVGDKRILVGDFYTMEEAAVERDKTAKELRGEYAALNFPDGPPPEIMQKILEGQQEYQKLVEARSVEKQSTHKGVSWNVKGQKWWARIRINGKRKLLGCFDTEAEAIEARVKAEVRKARLEAEAKYQ